MLRLEVLHSIQLPSGFEVRAIAPLPNKSIVVAAHARSIAIIDSLGRVSESSVMVGSGFLGLAAGACERCAMALIDSAGALKEVVIANGIRSRSWYYPRGWGVSWVAAAALNSRWIVGGVDSAGRVVVLILETPRPPRLIPGLERIQGTLSAVRLEGRQPLILTSGRDAVILTLVGAPHTAFVIDSLGHVPLVLARNAIGGGHEQDAQSSIHWIATGTLSLDSGYLSVIADPSSDNREVVLFNATGREIGTLQVNAPWGAAATRTEADELVALLAVDPPEVLFYRWVWRRSL